MSATHVAMFKERFAAAVMAGEKRQTLRPVGKRKYAAGDYVLLSKWSGEPRRSKQVRLGEGRLVQVATVVLERGGVTVGKAKLPPEAAETFAKADGFGSLAEMEKYFREEFGRPLPWAGQLLVWDPAARRPSAAPAKKPKPAPRKAPVRKVFGRLKRAVNYGTEEKPELKLTWFEMRQDGLHVRVLGARKRKEVFWPLSKLANGAKSGQMQLFVP